MSEPLCPHCLQPLRGRYEGNCPHCGRSLENRNPEGALPLGTQLAGRYTIGTYLSADGDGLAYRGILNEEKKFVLIKEYFPQRRRRADAQGRARGAVQDQPDGL